MLARKRALCVIYSCLPGHHWLLAMPDLVPLRSALLQHYPEAWVRHHLESFPAAYFEAFDEPAIDRHLGLMLQVSEERPVVVRTRPAAPGQWWVEVAGYDSFQFLSTLCSLLAVRGLAIDEGRVFTSQPPPREQAASRPARRGMPGRRPARMMRPAPAGGPDRRRKIVDVFRVSVDAPGEPAPDWDGFQAELTTLTRLLREGQYDEVHHRIINRLVVALARHRSGGEALEPLDLTIDPAGSDVATVVRIGARDSFGFLYLTASALALCGIMIIQADIRTQAGRVDDSLWVTDRFGRKIAAESKLRELRLSIILIEHFSGRLPRATNPEAALLHFSRFATDTMARPDWAAEFDALDRPEVLDALARVLGESDFLWEDYLRAQPDALLPMINDPAEWNRPRTPGALAAELDEAVASAGTFAARCQAIGRFKDREIFRAGIRSILCPDDGHDRFAAELTDLAEALLWAAYQVALEEAGPAPPRRADGRAVSSALCALGKFGGRELGFASDLELILVYADSEAADPPATMTTAAYFDRVVGLLPHVLASRRDGTFELDFRLRPYGKGGTPATALSTFLNYYRAGGPAWGYERQALIKLRAVAGDPAFGPEVETHRDRYVYAPEPFDLAGCQRMRRLQVEQLVAPGTINAKYSPGALVDIEYLVQALQIAYGRSDPALRSPSTLEALEALGQSGRLAASEVDSLRLSYRFFRTLIDALRVVHGHPKDLTVPRAGKPELDLLARRMRLESAAAFLAQLETHLQATRQLVRRLPELLPAGSPQIA